MNGFISGLAQQNVYTVLRQTSDGALYGITYVDNRTKCVFNGSDLGKGYSAAALQIRLSLQPPEKKLELTETKSHGSAVVADQQKRHRNQPKKTTDLLSTSNKLLETLLSTKEQYDNVPSNLLNKKKKKKKRKDGNS